MEKMDCVYVSNGKFEAFINLDDLKDWEKKGFKRIQAPSEEVSESADISAPVEEETPTKEPAKRRTRKRNVES
jgi:hypothetical protein